MICFRLNYYFQIPLNLCFDDYKASDFQNQFDYFITSYYFTDILLNFTTGYYEKELLVRNRKKIIIRYFKFWFWLDMISTMPYTYII